MSIVTKSKIIVAGLTLSFAIATAQNVPPPPGTGNTDPNVVANANNGGVNDSWKPALRRDGAIDKVEHAGFVTPWQNIREADVMWKKRVWREIDTRQKQNFPFRYPGDEESGGGYYIEILMDAIKQGKITAFSDERFTIPLTADDVMSKVVGKPDSTIVENADGSTKLVITNKGFNPDGVTKFRLKEDWIFDRNVGRMVCRIIGLSPILDKYGEDGLFRATMPMFWLYYQDARALHSKYEIYNPENDVYRITWDDFFEKRMFSSYITKSSIDNPYGDDISVTKKGIDKLYEAEQIKEKMFNKEHDMWVE
jgi:gliding motility associated protien GldN